MGTRGVYGFRVDGKDYLTYNGFDSYPEWLGEHLVEEIKDYLTEGTLDGMAENVRRIKFVNSSDKPTEADFEKYSAFSAHVSTGEDWYSLLRNMQGSIKDILKYEIMIERADFIWDSLFCEYGYIINLDTNKFEVYRGNQSVVHYEGRYGGEVPEPFPYASGYKTDKYYGCRLVEEFDLNDIPDDWITRCFPEKED